MSLFLSLSASAMAGVWVHRPGTGYAQLGFTHQQSNAVFLPGARAVPQTDEALMGHLSPLFEEGQYSANDANLYLELGVVRGIEVMASLPWRAARNRWTLARGSYGDIVHRNQGLGDLLTGVRFGTVKGGLAVSGLVAGRAPLYDNSPEVLNMEPGDSFFEDDRVPLGAGTLELEAFAGVGVSSRRSWAQLDTGLRVRDRHYSSVLPVRLQVGVRPIPRVTASLSADAQVALANGSAPEFYLSPYGKGPLVVDGQSFLNASLGASVEATRGFGLTSSIGRTLVGVRFPRLTTVTVGLYSDFALPWARKEGA